MAIDHFLHQQLYLLQQPIQLKLAKLYCQTLDRYPSSESIKVNLNIIILLCYAICIIDLISCLSGYIKSSDLGLPTQWRRNQGGWGVTAPQSGGGGLCPPSSH